MIIFAILKGWFGEKATQFGMWRGLDTNVSRRVHDLALPSQGGTTQIDHILVSVYGIFVIETKNMKGWIFGDERSPGDFCPLGNISIHTAGRRWFWMHPV